MKHCIKKSSIPEIFAEFGITATKIKNILLKELAKYDSFEATIDIQHFRIDLQIYDYYNKKGREWKITKVREHVGGGTYYTI